MKFPKYKNSRRVEAKTILIMWSIFQSETNLNIKSCLEFRRTDGECMAWNFNNFQLFFRVDRSDRATRVTFESIVDELKWWITEKFNYARFLLFGGRVRLCEMSSRGVNRVTWQLWSEKRLHFWFFVGRLITTTASHFWRFRWWQPSQKANPVLNLSFFIANFFFCENIFYRHPSHAIPFHWIVLWANEATPLGWVFMNGIDWFSVCSLDSPFFSSNKFN